MGIVSKCWFRDEVLHTFSTQLPNNLMQNIAFVTNATDLDKLTDEMKFVNSCKTFIEYAFLKIVECRKSIASHKY